LAYQEKGDNMMKKQLFASAGLCALSAAVLLASVKTDFSRSADFDHYHTYSWIGVKAGNQLLQDRIMRAVDSQLSAKGWSKVATGGDASVSAFGSTKDQPNMQILDALPGWDWGGIEGSTFESTPVGTLVIGIFDSQSKKLIWRGRDNQVLSGKPQENEGKLDSAVKEMLEQFPPSVRQERG
jgi:hypothetical protein